MAFPSRLIPEPLPGFTRSLVQTGFKSVIRSSCDYCGLSIAGHTAESVWEEEIEHRDCCREPQKPIEFDRAQ